MHWQMRNWYYFTWLSGDFNVEQHVHNLDVCAWAMGNQYPVKAIGMGGREVLTGPEYGVIYDHFSVTYEYANGARLMSNCRQQAALQERHQRQGAWAAKGTGGPRRNATGRHADLEAGQRKEWVYSGQRLTKSVPDRARRTLRRHSFRQADQQRRIHGEEHFACHHGTHGCLHGPGHHLGHGDELEFREDLDPPRYEWTDIPAPPVAVPGVTRFV